MKKATIKRRKRVVPALSPTPSPPRQLIPRGTLNPDGSVSLGRGREAVSISLPLPATAYVGEESNRLPPFRGRKRSFDSQSQGSERLSSIKSLLNPREGEDVVDPSLRAGVNGGGGNGVGGYSPGPMVDFSEREREREREERREMLRREAERMREALRAKERELAEL